MTGIPRRKLGTTGDEISSTRTCASPTLRLTDADLDAVAAAIRASDAGTGPERPA